LNKKYLLIAAGVVIALAVGLGLYQWWQNRQLSPAWAAVPANAIMVAEADEPFEIWQQWQQNPAWQPLLAWPYFQILGERIQALQTYPESKEVIAGKKILFSLHVTTRQDFDYVFYVPLSKNQLSSTRALIQRFRTDAQFRTDTRTFGGELITEITHRASRQQFSLILLDDLLIGSYTPFLVEDVIRKANENTVSRQSQWTDWHAIGSAKNAPLRMYINLAATPRLIQVLTGTAEAGLLPTAGQLASLAMTQEKNSIFLKGKTYLNQQPEMAQYLRVFEGQSPQPVSCLSLIPNQTAVLYHWSFSDSRAFFGKQPAPSGQLAVARKYTWIGKEMALMLVETTGDQPDRLLCVQATNLTTALQQIHNTQRNRNTKRPYTEKYRGATIRQTTESEFPAWVFGTAINGFAQSFYAVVGQYVVFGNSVQAIKHLLDSRATGEVWSQSARQRDYFSRQKPAHLTLHVDVSHAWALLLRQASPHWRQLLLQHSNELKDFNNITLHIGNSQSHAFETEVQVNYREKTTAAALQNKFFVNWRTTADTTLAMVPVLVRNHTDGSREVLLQDAANRLYLVSQSGRIGWRHWLDSPVQSDIHQIDFLKNNKLQYLFVTKHNLYVLDRNGNPVAPYPVRSQTSTGLHTLSLIDYEGNLDYRFLVSDLLGNLYMYNKAGTLLEGWNPLRTGYRLQCPPHHIRIHDKDYFVVLQANGKLTLLNRRGQVYAGFPMDLKARTESAFFIENGLSPEATYITIVTREGEIIRVNLLGEIQKRQQLYRTSGNNTFRLCAEPQGRDWVIARQDNHNVGIMDKNGQLLWETTDDPAGDQLVQYYNFGAGLRLVAITAAKKTVVYNLTGHQIGAEPLSSQFPVAVVYIDAYDKLLIHTAHDRQLSVTSVKVK